MLQISFIKLLVIFAVFSLAPYGDCKDDKKDKKDNKVKGLAKIDECFGQIIQNSKGKDAGSQCQGEDKKCQMLCQMDKLGLVSNGSLNTDSMNQFVSETYPEESRSLINKRINECVEKEGKQKKLVKSKNCKDSEKLTKCISKSIKKVCKMGILIIKESNSTTSSRNSSALTPINNNGNGSTSSNMTDQGQIQNSTGNNSTDQNQIPNTRESNSNSTSSGSSSRVKRDLMTSVGPGQWTTPSSIYNPTTQNPNAVYAYTTGVYRPTTMKRK